MKYLMKVEPYSDDIVYFKITENIPDVGAKTLFHEETYKTDVVYDVNGDFKIVIQFEKSPTGNWMIGVGDLNETSDLDGNYSIYYVLDGYKPVLHVESERPFVIDGLYGTREVEMKDKLWKSVSDLQPEQVDEIIGFLKKEKLL